MSEDGKLVLVGGKLTLVGGLLALDDDCCCEPAGFQPELGDTCPDCLQAGGTPKFVTITISGATYCEGCLVNPDTNQSYRLDVDEGETAPNGIALLTQDPNIGFRCEWKASIPNSSFRLRQWVSDDCSGAAHTDVRSISVDYFGRTSLAGFDLSVSIVFPGGAPDTAVYFGGWDIPPPGLTKDCLFNPTDSSPDKRFCGDSGFIGAEGGVGSMQWGDRT